MPSRAAPSLGRAISPAFLGARARFGGTTLRTRLLLVVALAFLPALALTVFTHREEGRLDVETVAHRGAVTARMAAGAYERFLEGARHALMAYAQIAQSGSHSRGESAARLRHLLARYPHFANLGVVEKDGTVFASALPLAPDAGADGRVHIQGVLASNDFSLGIYRSGSGVSRPGIDCGFPIHDASGAVRQVVFASLDVQNLAYAGRELPIRPEEQVILLDAKGTILAAHPANAGRAGDLFPAMAALTTPADRGPGSRPALREYDGKLYASAMVRLGRDSGLRVVYAIGLQAAYRPAQRRLHRTLLWLAVTGILILLLGWSAGHYFITRHVQKLVDAAQRLSEGDLSSRTGVAHEPGELGRLAAAVDHMAISLQGREEELKTAQQELERQVADRTLELRATNRQLEAFSYSVSHDLRAPLRAIDGFSQILLNEHAEGLTPEGRHLLDIVVKNSKQMSLLIEDLLLYARMGREEPRLTEVDMGAIARDVFEELAVCHRERRIKLEVLPMPAAKADAGMMLQVWMCLLSNAVKFTAKRSEAIIEVGGEEGPTHNTFHVRDNGVGFDAHYSHRLFQVFQRLHSSAEFDGTGVGLAIARRIVEKHTGKLWAETALGHGATFFFSLPRGPV